MNKMKWFYILAFIGGGLLVVAVAYLLLRTSGLWNKMLPADNNWVEYEA